MFAGPNIRTYDERKRNKIIDHLCLNIYAHNSTSVKFRTSEVRTDSIVLYSIDHSYGTDLVS